jgi:hypothetical protein
MTMPWITPKSDIEGFASQLVENIANRYPAQIDNDRSKRPSEARLTRIVEEVCDKAVAFKRERKLGWLGKARLGNALRWQLKEKGYQSDFIELATEALVVSLARSKVS